MRVQFVIPRSHNPKQTYREYPLGAGFLGTILKGQGHEVRILDQNAEGVDDAAVLRQIADFAPQVVAFSIITPNYPVARRQIDEIGRRWPDTKVIAGGVHASLFPEHLLTDGADVVVLGEGEPVIAELVRRLEEHGNLDELNGLAFRDANGRVVRTQRQPCDVAIDELPIIDRTLYNLPCYTHHSMLASRGCPYHCAFCCNFTGTVRADSVAVRQPERVIDEMLHLRDRFDASEIFFADDMFLIRKKEILAFCASYMARKVGIRWIAQMRADRIDQAVAEAMAGAGCQRIYFGVESGSEAILKNAGKGMSKEQIRQGIHAALAAGLRVKTGWIYGLPGTIEEQYDSIRFMLELRPHEISIHQLIPFPGTIYYSEPQRFGIRIADPLAFESFCYGGLEGDVRFDYLSQAQLVRLLEDTGRALEEAGYVSSDRAAAGSPYVYTTPLSKNSMNVFRRPILEPAA